MPSLFDDILNAPQPSAPAPGAGSATAAKPDGLFDDILNAPKAEAPASGTAATALPDIDDPQGPLYGQRHGGSAMTALIDSMKDGAGSAAVGMGLADGVPVIGPYLKGGLTNAAAAVRALKDDVPFSEAKGKIEDINRGLETEHPGAVTGGQIAGGVLSMAPAVMAAPAMFGAGSGAIGARSIASLATGGLIGGADAGARGQDPVVGGAIGGLAGAASPMIAAGVGKLAGSVVSKFRPGEVAPSADELKAAARAAYQRADDAGVQIAQPSFAAAIQDARAAAADAGIDKTLHPRASAVLERLDQASGMSPTLRQVDLMRRVAKSAAGSIEPDERRIGSLIVDKLDDFVGGLKQADLVSGDAETATAALGEARGLWARARKADMIDDALERGERRAASTGTGGNADNATRQNIRSILDNPRKARGFSDEEQAAMERVVRGTPMQNAARLIGKLSPESGMLPLALNLASNASTGGASIPLSIAAAAGKRIADAATAKNVTMLEQLIANGRPTQASPQSLLAQERARALSQQMFSAAPPVANQRR